MIFGRMLAQRAPTMRLLPCRALNVRKAFPITWSTLGTTPRLFRSFTTDMPVQTGDRLSALRALMKSNDYNIDAL